MYKAGDMNALTVDSATGFLTSSDHGTFDAESKIKVLQLARECVEKDRYPRISMLCKAVGIYPQTFHNHLQQDNEFRNQWESVLIEIEEMLSESLVENAKRANGVGAAAFWLKNRMSHRWSDNPGQNNLNINDIGWIKKISDAIADTKPTVIATEAEIISTPKPDSGLKA